MCSLSEDFGIKLKKIIIYVIKIMMEKTNQYDLLLTINDFV